MKLLQLINYLVYYWMIYLESTVTSDMTRFYWRDYEDKIPSDAIPADVNSKNETFYIGQAMVQSLSTIIPGKIDHKENILYSEYGGEEYATKVDVKILCTAHPELFQWVSAKRSERFYDMLRKNQQLIIGGHEGLGTTSLVIGRKFFDNKFHIGKVPIYGELLHNLYLTKDKKGWSEVSYDILVYTRSDVPEITKNTSTTNEVKKRDCIKNTIQINIWQ